MKKIQIEQFEGPLEFLLELIEHEKLSITDISLSQVTEQYLKMLEGLAEKNAEDLADFLVVASKLLLIKSRVLLPELVLEDEDESDLALQLKMYKEYYDASKVITQMIAVHHFSFSREKPAVSITPVFNPPKSLNQGLLLELFRKVLKDIEPIVELPREVIRRAVSLQEKISNIQQMISREATVQFSNILKNSKSKMEVIVTFLAILELVKQRIVVVRQEEIFEDIFVESTEIIN
jgi:segregation and condensation protein A